MGVEVIKINENTWYIEENQHVRFYLLAGSKEALLIDTGMNVENVKGIVKELTDLPVKLINTHADVDHVGGNKEFDIFYMHPSECSNYYKNKKGTGDFIPVEDGEKMDLGDRPLEIILIPGHTPGSIAILDVNNKMLFSGDPVQDGTIYMFGIQRELHAYKKSLLKLQKLQERFENIYPAHGTTPVQPQIIGELLQATDQLLNGELPYEEVDMWGNKIKKVDAGVATFLVD